MPGGGDISDNQPGSPRGVSLDHREVYLYNDRPHLTSENIDIKYIYITKPLCSANDMKR